MRIFISCIMAVLIFEVYNFYPQVWFPMVSGFLAALICRESARDEL